MNENGGSQSMTGTAQLDLADLDLGFGPWPCMVLFDLLGCPDHLDVQLPLKPKAWNELTQHPELVRDRRATVTLADGTTLVADVQIFGCWHGDMIKDGNLCKEMSATFYLGKSVWHKYPSAGADLWRFGLTNVKLNHADYVTEYGSGDSRRVVLNVVRFHVAGRDWMLTDDFAEKWRELDKEEMAHPLLTARLETPHRDGDKRESLEALATDIEALLRLALSRSVTWVSSARVAAGKVVEEHYRGAWTAPFRISSFPINNGFDRGQLKAFIETAYPNYAAHRDWFCVSTILYLMSQIGSHLEVRMSLQNTLLDRMAEKVLEKDDDAEIDHELPGRLSREFKDRLHGLLSELSPKWTRDHTGRLIGAIRDWNKNPSFPGGVERAAVRLGLWPPEKGQLAKRHKLIHRGEYDASDGTSVYDYWKGIECLVVMMLLRMLGYSGPFYHLAFGSNPVLLQDFMQGGSKRPPYPVEETAPGSGLGQEATDAETRPDADTPDGPD